MSRAAASAKPRRHASPAPAAPLTRRLQAPARATARELYALALAWWERGERFDIGRMAAALGVSRATVFRWVGSRELLYGEVISSLFAQALAEAGAAAKARRLRGPALLADVTRRLLQRLMDDVPLQRFVHQDAEYAMRVLMSRSSTVEQRCAASVREALKQGVREGHIRPAMDLDALAYLIVRIGESFLYRDAITGEAADIEPAITAIRLLLTARPGSGR
jgi:AcrR family transcriptional regulator